MMLLPKLLYLFIRYSTYISPHTLSVVQIMINYYIWSYRKPRGLLQVLMRPKTLGGVGTPNLQNYHLTTLLTQLKF